MVYDEQKLRTLEGEARAAAFRLGKVAAPVQNRMTAEQLQFDILSVTLQDCERRSELESLLSTMQAYCEATAAYSEQLAANLKATQEAMYSEATRASFMARQFQLVHEDLAREKQQTSKWWNTCQALLADLKGGRAA